MFVSNSKYVVLHTEIFEIYLFLPETVRIKQKIKIITSTISILRSAECNYYVICIDDIITRFKTDFIMLSTFHLCFTASELSVSLSLSLSVCLSVSLFF